MTTEQKNIIKNTWLKIATLDDKVVGALFYDRLFSIAPEVRPLFLNPVPEQSKKLMVMLHFMVRNVDQPNEISTTISALAKRHDGYSVKPYHYAIAGNALLWTLEQGLGTVWSDEVKEAWAVFYTQVSETMISVQQSVTAVA